MSVKTVHRIYLELYNKVFCSDAWRAREKDAATLLLRTTVSETIQPFVDPNALLRSVKVENSCNG